MADHQRTYYRLQRNDFRGALGDLRVLLDSAARRWHLQSPTIRSDDSKAHVLWLFEEPKLGLVLGVMLLAPEGKEVDGASVEGLRVFLNRQLRSLVTVLPPRSRSTLRPSENLAEIDVLIDEDLGVAMPSYPEVKSPGECLRWRLLNVPEKYWATIDFVLFQPGGPETRTKTFEPPFRTTTVSGNTVTCGGRKGPAGQYWYKVTLIPRDYEDHELIRLRCRPPVLDQDAAGIELSGEPSGFILPPLTP
ncbi:MAG: hypothetical protein AAF657_15705 [Acidobacteriota bacterium]